MDSAPLRLVRDRITRAEIAGLAEAGFGDMVKAVVDVERRTMAIGGELQSDEEAAVLDDGSGQSDLWASTSTPVSKGKASSTPIRWSM